MTALRNNPMAGRPYACYSNLLPSHPQRSISSCLPRARVGEDSVNLRRASKMHTNVQNGAWRHLPGMLLLQSISTHQWLLTS